MSNPIMMVRKIKHNVAKNEQYLEHNKPIKLVLPEDLKSGLSRKIGMNQGSMNLNKSRSSSSIKKLPIQNSSTNITPLNKKLRNLSYLMGTTPDISENISELPSSDEQKHRILNNLEIWLCEQRKICNKIETFIEALKKIPQYDISLKRLIDEIVGGIQCCVNFDLKTSQGCHEDAHQTQELKKVLSEVIQERNKLKRDAERFNNVLKFMKLKKEIPVEQYFQEFNEIERKNEKKKKAKIDAKSRVQSVPKLAIAPGGEVGFHQEFMAKVDEFSDSWRALIKQEKNN